VGAGGRGRRRGELLIIKCVFGVSLQLLSEIFFYSKKN